MQKLNLNSQPATLGSDQLEQTTNPSQTHQSSQSDAFVSKASSVKTQLKPGPTLYLWWFLVVIVSIGLGMATGFGAARLYAGKPTNPSTTVVQPGEANMIQAGDVFGSEDEAFKDSAEGYLESGGLDGEGSHRLLRPGGPSQTVYLTSSVMDLDKFVGMQVKVYGETYQGQKAGWLMDVGKIEVINPKGEKPPETWAL